MNTTTHRYDTPSPQPRQWLGYVVIALSLAILATTGAATLAIVEVKEVLHKQNQLADRQIVVLYQYAEAMRIVLSRMEGRDVAVPPQYNLPGGQPEVIDSITPVWEEQR